LILLKELYLIIYMGNKPEKPKPTL